MEERERKRERADKGCEKKSVSVCENERERKEERETKMMGCNMASCPNPCMNACPPFYDRASDGFRRKEHNMKPLFTPFGNVRE